MSSYFALALILALLALGVLVMAMRRRPRSSIAPSGSTALVRAVAPVPQPEPRAAVVTRLVAGNPNNPAISITRTDGSGVRARQPLNLDSDMLSRLSPLLQHAPALALEVATATSQHLYQLSFSPEVMRDLANGSLSLKESLVGGFRAMAEDASGRTVEHGSLLSPDVLRAGAAAAMVWQVLSVAVGQKHLSDINRKLATLGGQVSQIRQWLESEQAGKLRGSFDHLIQINRAISNRSFDPEDALAFRVKIDDIEHETVQIIRHQEQRMQAARDELPRIKLDEFGLSRPSRHLETELRDFERLVQGWRYAQAVRLIAAQTRCALPGGHIVGERRVREVAEAFSGFDQVDLYAADFNKLVADKLHSFLRRDSSLAAQAAVSGKMNELAAATRNNRQKDEQTISNALGNIHLLKTELDDHTHLEVRTDAAGRILGVDRVAIA